MFQIPDRKILHFFDTRVASKQFIKFALVGTFNTLVDFTVYIFFTRVITWPYLVAATLSFLVAVTSSFLLNRYWTFRVQNKNFVKEYCKFVLVASGGLLLSLSLLFILVERFYWYDLLAKLLIVLVVMNWNFFLQKYWTFKK